MLGSVVNYPNLLAGAAAGAAACQHPTAHLLLAAGAAAGAAAAPPGAAPLLTGVVGAAAAATGQTAAAAAAAHALTAAPLAPGWLASRLACGTSYASTCSALQTHRSPLYTAASLQQHKYQPLTWTKSTTAELANAL